MKGAETQMQENVKKGRPSTEASRSFQRRQDGLEPRSQIEMDCQHTRMEIQVSGHYLHTHIIHNGHIVVFHRHQDGYLHHIQEDGRHPSMVTQKNGMHNAAQMDVRKMVPLYGCLNGCLNDVRYGIDFSDTHTCVFFFFFDCIRSPEKLI